MKNFVKIFVIATIALSVATAIRANAFDSRAFALEESSVEITDNQPNEIASADEPVAQPIEANVVDEILDNFVDDGDIEIEDANAESEMEVVDTKDIDEGNSSSVSIEPEQHGCNHFWRREYIPETATSEGYIIDSCLHCCDNYIVSVIPPIGE